MLPSFAHDTVFRLRPSTKTERGSAVPDWNNPNIIAISDCSMQPSSSSLSEDGRVLGISDSYTCYMPINADVKAGDRIRFNSLDYTINGDPRNWVSPSGRVSHITLQLERWYG